MTEWLATNSGRFGGPIMKVDQYRSWS